MFTFFLIVLILAIAIMVLIISRRLPQIKMIKIDSSAQVKQNDLKKDIYEKRLQRSFSDINKIVINFFQPVWQDMSKIVKSFYNYLRQKEENYRYKLLSQDFKNAISKEQKIAVLLTEAQEFLEARKYDEAENKYIEILKIDQYNNDAYRNMAMLYWEKKDYDHAVEVFEYLLKISDNFELYNDLALMAEERGNLKAAEDYYFRALNANEKDVEFNFKLAQLYKQQESYPKAIENINKALLNQPNNPKYLDFLLQISIIMQDKNSAIETLDKLRQVNPENNKLEDYQEQIDKI